MWEELLGLLGIAVTALVGYFFTVRQKLLEERRKACAQALTDALAWRELPYRVRRRLDNEKATRNELVQRMHALQEALYFHENWLRIELPDTQPLYAALVKKSKESTAEALKAAWATEPIDVSAMMNIGDLNFNDIGEEIEAFAAAARRRLSWWRP